MSSPPRCLICNSLLSFHQAAAGRVCASPRCRWELDHVPPHRACSVCGRPLSPRELAAHVCSDPVCHRTHHDKLWRDRWEGEYQRIREQKGRARQIRDRSAATAGVPDPETYTLGLVPSVVVGVTPLGDDRRQEFRKRLAVLAAKAIEPGEEQAAPAASSPAPYSSAVLATLGGACGHCQGSCCRGGAAAYAYLSEATLRRYMASRLGSTAEQVVDEYMARIGPETYEASCVYHGPAGCTLTREMRSDTCNQYFCPGLKSFLRNLPEDGPPRGFFASTQGSVIVGAAFIDESGSRPVPVDVTPAT